MSPAPIHQPEDFAKDRSRMDGLRNDSGQILGNGLSTSDVIDHEPASQFVQHGKRHHEPGLPRNHQSSNRVENDGGHTKRTASARTTSSGSFLLSSPVSRFRPTPLSHSQVDSSRDGAKSRKEKSELLISKRRGKTVLISPIGSSPLANQVSTLENDIGEHARRDRDDEARGDSSFRSSQDRDWRKSLSIGSSRQGDSQDGSERTGFDTDPTQIVNMALSLSEGRRRQASEMRSNGGYVRQSVSLGKHGHIGSIHNRNSPRQLINSDRIFSQNAPSQNDGADWPTMPRQSVIAGSSTGGNIHSGGLDESDMVFGDDVYDVSNATMMRVQKAKTHFELFYEHLRLLPHLPPLRTATRSQQGERGEGRSYNPLQYARNRKIRFKEKTPEIDSEVWHDSQRVRAWVNAIVDDHTERRTNADECIRLPALANDQVEASADKNTASVNNSPAGSKQESEMKSSTKSSRPRSDWVVMPGDLMGDVYWLEQGSNKVKIEDSSGNKIYLPSVKLEYKGWRNRDHAQVDNEKQQMVVTTPEKDRHATVSSTAGPELPTFTSTGRHEKPRGRLRRRGSKVPTSSSSDVSHSRSPKRGKRLKKNLVKKAGKETSSQSDDEQSSAGPLKGSRHRGRRLFDAGRNRVVELVPKIVLDDTDPSSRAERRDSSALSFAGVSQDQGENELLKTSTKDSVSSQKRSISDQGQNPPPKSKKRPSRLSLDTEGPRRHSLEYDSTAPSSPSAYQLPSIAINLSPPASRSPSPTKRVLHSRINRFREQRPFKPRHSIDAGDTADVHSLKSSRPEDEDFSTEDRTVADSSRDASPMTKTAVRTSSSISTRGDSPRSQVNAMKAPLKSPVTGDNTGRIRGLFKGGRIAQLVGNEVSRVGEYIWKREIPSAAQGSSSSSRNESLSQSETEDDNHENSTTSQKPPRPSAKRAKSNVQVPGSLGEKRPSNEHRESYFTPNLPSFTSPFQKDRDLQAQRERSSEIPGSYPQATDTSDHISLAAALHRTVSKSPRLDEIAPPKLTITRGRSVRPSPVDQTSLDAARELRFNGSMHPSLDLNSALAGLRSQPGIATRKVSQSGVDANGRTWSPHTHNHNCNVSLKDIARARALLLSSGAKARQIFLIANKIRRHPPHFLLSTIPSPTDAAAVQSLRVARKDEFLLFCHNLSPILTSTSTNIRQSTDTFTHTTTISLHTHLQDLDDLISNTLTPRVRAAADESGELGMKLATTCALATKGMDDIVGNALRRKKRRGPVRWVRRVGYGVVEWAVVGVLWAIWFVVSGVKTGVALGRGVWRVGRWLLWID